jgi:hypothetical protein
MNDNFCAGCKFLLGDVCPACDVKANLDISTQKIVFYASHFMSIDEAIKLFSEPFDYVTEVSTYLEKQKEKEFDLIKTEWKIFSMPLLIDTNCIRYCGA